MNLLVYCLNTAKQNFLEFFVCRAVSRNYKKFELMLTRRAKAYSSSGSVV